VAAAAVCVRRRRRLVGPVQERAMAAVGKGLGARVAARATRQARGARRRAGGGVRRAQRLGMTPTRGAHLPERGREEGRGSRGLGREGEGEEILFTLVIYLFSEIE